MALWAADEPQPKIAIVDAGIGSCAIDFTVKDDKGAPVYDAKIRTHISHGFVSMRKLDLEAATNSEGNARFTGLPDKLKQPLVFRATQGDQEGSVSYTLSRKCPPPHETIILHKSAAPQ
jgi:hypothetical protein